MLKYMKLMKSPEGEISRASRGWGWGNHQKVNIPGWWDGGQDILRGLSTLWRSLFHEIKIIPCFFTIYDCTASYQNTVELQWLEHLWDHEN